jgi:hypothetical protein
MNISGVDTIFPNLGTPYGMELAARIIMRRWPRAVFQAGSYACKFAEVPFGHAASIFVYHDLETLLCWDTSEDFNKMIELSIVPGGLMVVVGDDKNPTTAGILSELGSVRLP